MRHVGVCAPEPEEGRDGYREMASIDFQAVVFVINVRKRPQEA